MTINMKGIVTNGWVLDNARDLAETLVMGAIFKHYTDMEESIGLMGAGKRFRQISETTGKRNIVPRIITDHDTPIIYGKENIGARSIAGVLGVNTLRNKNGTGPRSLTGECDGSTSATNTLRNKNGTGPRSLIGECEELNDDEIIEKTNTDRKNLAIRISFITNATESNIKQMVKEGVFSSSSKDGAVSKILKYLSGIVNGGVSTAIDSIEEADTDNTVAGDDSDVSGQSVEKFVDTVITKMKDKYDAEKEKDEDIATKIKEDDTDAIPVDEDDQTDVIPEEDGDGEDTGDAENDEDDKDDKNKTLADLTEVFRSAMMISSPIFNEISDNVESALALTETMFKAYNDKLYTMGEDFDSDTLQEMLKQDIHDTIACGKILYNIGMVSKPSVFFNKQNQK